MYLMNGENKAGKWLESNARRPVRLPGALPLRHSTLQLYVVSKGTQIIYLTESVWVHDSTL
jgi:hypothetical protein